MRKDDDVQQQLQRYALAVAGAGFVLAWTTLGLATAVLAVLGAAAAVHLHRLPAMARQHRRTRARAARPVARARRLRDEAEDLPLVPDEPSLILTAGQF